MHYTTAAEAVKLIRSNDSVYIQGSTSIPETLVAAMAERGGELEHVTVYSAFAVGAFDAPYCRPEYKESFLVNSLFVANNIRRWLADGYGQTIPAFLGEIPALFRDGTLPLDVALINVSPPDAEGYCSFGVSDSPTGRRCRSAWAAFRTPYWRPSAATGIWDCTPRR